MGKSNVGSLARVVGGLVVACMVALSPARAADLAAADAVRDHLGAAETAYWFGMAEHGNLRSFQQGLAELKSADRLLEAGRLAPAEGEVLRRRVTALRAALEAQADRARGTLVGVFPLTRLLTASLFSDAGAADTFELVDDPASTAVSQTVEALTGVDLTRAAGLAQLETVVTSSPRQPEMEAEVRYQLGEHPTFAVVPDAALAGMLPAQLLARLHGGRVDPEVTAALANALGVGEVLVVAVKQLAARGSDACYEINAGVYPAGSSTPVVTVRRRGLAHDRRDRLPWLVLLHGLLLAVAAVLVMAKARGAQVGFVRAAALGGLGWVFGRVAPWALVPMLASVAPPPETPVLLAFWWPFAVGLVLYAGPLLVLRVAAARLGGRSRLFLPPGLNGPLFAAVSLGTSAYLAVPTALAGESRAMWLVAVPAALVAAVAAWLLGRGLDRHDPLPTRLAPALLVVLATVVALVAALDEVVLGGLAVGAVAGAGVAWRLGRKRMTEEPVRSRATAGVASGKVVGALLDGVRRPPFLEHDGATLGWRCLARTLGDGAPSTLVLHGPSGRGKSRTADELVERLAREAAERGRPQPLVLRGSCPVPLAHGGGLSAPPLEPFRQALGPYLAPGLLEDAEGTQPDALGTTLGSVVEAVPFLGMLVSVLGGEPAADKQELFHSVAMAVERLAARRPVVLILDDLQWCDGTSRELLAALHEAVQRDAVAVALVLTTHRLDALPPLEGAEVVEVPVFDLAMKVRLLERLGIERASAERIAREVVVGGDAGELTWLLGAVSFLVRSGALEHTDAGFVLTPAARRAEVLPVPSELEQAIVQEIDTWPQYREMLELAACAGFEVRASLLAEALGQTRLEVIRLLEEIEQHTDLLHDRVEGDDIFEMRSKLVHRVIRDRAKAANGSPRERRMPQRVREFHARLADAYDRRADDNVEALFAAATHHYFAAGPSYGRTHARQGARRCVEAASAAATRYDFDQARERLRMARQCTEVVGSPPELVRLVAEEELAIACQRAHVEQRGCVEPAERIVRHLESETAAPDRLRILAARACYDAARTTGDQTWYARTVEIADSLARAASDALVEAEAAQLAALGLPPGEATAAERRSRLEHALELVRSHDDGSAAARALEGRVSDSLAGLLTYSPDLADRQAARRLLERAIELKSAPEIADRPGLARSHGGMGRLLLQLEPPEVAEARRHFQQDLELARSLGDVPGECQVESHLGECDMLEQRWGAALEHYRRAWRLAQRCDGPGHRVFALCGLVEAAGHGEPGVAVEAVESLLGVLEDGGTVPAFCLARVRQLLKADGLDEGLRQALANALESERPAAG